MRNFNSLFSSDPSRSSKWSVQVIIFLLSLGVISYLSSKIPVLYLEDSLDFIYRARFLFEGPTLEIFVNGFYPFGYPVLLRMVYEVSGDYLVAQKIISAISGALLILYFYKTCRLFFPPYTSLFACLFLCFHSFFLIPAATDNTDMIATTLVFMSIYYIIKNPESFKNCILCGVILGLAYLCRYTSLLILPIILFWILIYYKSDIRKTVPKILSVLISFLIISSPQLVLSYVYKGNIFFNSQHANVWFGIYGEDDFAKNWNLAQHYKSLWEVINLNPQKFFDNLIKNVSIVFFMTFFKYPLFIMSYVGLIFLMGDKKYRAKGGLIVMTGIFFGLAICMAFIRTRLVLFVLPGQIFLSIYGVEAIFNFLRDKKKEISEKLIYMLKSITYTIVLILIILDHTFKVFERPITEEQEEILKVGKSLHLAGMDKPYEVLSFSFRSYDVVSPYKEGFQLPWYWHGQSFYSSSEIVDYMHLKGHKFLVYDKNAVSHIPGLAGFWDKMPTDTLFLTHFKPVFEGEYYHAYQVKK